MPRSVNGILLLDKPPNISSNGALQRVKQLFNATKAGHTGSLDLLATGMLPICFGEATKFSQYLLNSNKTYYVVAQLGAQTNTGDAEGEIIATQSIEGITAEKITSILAEFTGEISQIPPMYSALKHKGKPLYKLARKGIEIEREPRSVHIFSLQLEELNADKMTLVVSCSKGTYIRTLIEDIGMRLGCLSYVAYLRRTAISHYQSGQMHTLAELIAMADRSGIESLDTCLQPIESAIESLPAIKLSIANAHYIKMGQTIRATVELNTNIVRVFAEDGKFLGIAEVLADGRIKPSRMVA